MARKADYGRGHPDFLRYVHFIAGHSVYAGMPDAYLETGDVQWEAPSNRQSGKFKDTHLKRLEWWRQKALKEGINPNAGGSWISRTAKKIHPTKEKPCKNCGRVLDIRYVYPSSNLLERVKRLPYVDETFALDPLEHIRDLVSRMVEQFGNRVFQDLPALLRTKSLTIPQLRPDLDTWLQWIVNEYVPSEPRTLSPGAMSNAPDRFDGFHSFNRCCREHADRGRSKQNLQSYTTDRRVFEYWIDGDWVAADRLMGLIRSDLELQSEPCLRGHPGPCDADHIGPISLGFAHRPQFQFLCQACNSAKNNRMFLSDVQLLRQAEDTGQTIASWYSQDLWTLRKFDVTTEEAAGRLSRLLRDNRHTVMFVLKRLVDQGHYAFLSTYLGLRYADYDVSFEGLRAKRHLTSYTAIRRQPRTTKYAAEQKARRLRVAFSALNDYVKKEGRNAFIITGPEIEQQLDAVQSILNSCPAHLRQIDEEIADIFSEEVPSEERLRVVVNRIPTEPIPACYMAAREALRKAMSLVAHRLNSLWDSDRYVRVISTGVADTD